MRVVDLLGEVETVVHTHRSTTRWQSRGRRGRREGAAHGEVGVHSLLSGLNQMAIARPLCGCHKEVCLCCSEGLCEW